tara:strand:- start:3849 stop:4577 length:729 start_codon:yes stop_codon:yes gene_type:complete
MKKIAWNKGKKLSYEYRQKMSKAHKGKIVSEETKKKMSLSMVKAHKENPNAWLCSKETRLKMRFAKLGKKRVPHTEATKRKIGLGNKGKIRSEETREKLRIVNLGKVVSKETVLKILEKIKGRKRSKETKQRLSLAKMGNKNPAWNNGSSFEPYGIDFNEKLKELIRERDGYYCRLCNKKQGRKEKFPVHHIDYIKQNNDPLNLITLCKSCHSKTNFNRKRWSKIFNKLINTNIILTGEMNG